MTIGPMSTRARMLGYGAVVGLAVAIVIAAVLVTRQTPGSGGRTLTEHSVVADLRSAGAVYPDALRVQLQAARAAPEDRDAGKTAARALIAEGRLAGDSRLVGAAIGILRPFLDAPDAETLYLAATARQYQHDFTGAVAMLDQALMLDPRDANVLLTRATIRTVQGQFDMALDDCRRISALSRADLGFLCQSTALLLTAQAPAVYARLAAILAQPGLLDPALRPWAVGLMGEIAALQRDSATAQAHFSEVLAADPQALRERLLLADLLLANGRGDEVLALLEPAPEVDGVLIRRVLAGSSGSTATAADRAELERRFRLNLDLGLTAHAREEARYFLQIAGDAPQALARALVNWDLQHEIEDAQLLIDAAVAAGRPEAAAPVLDWMADQAVKVPTLRIPDAVRAAR
jgi:tetratricopeptide (TPR) repeat protein